MGKNRHDEFVDSYLKYAGEELLSKLAEEAPSEEELADFEIPSNNIDQRISATINKEVNMRRRKRSLKIATRVAAGLIIVLIVSTITIASSEAIRTRFFDFFKTSDEVSETIIVSDDSDVQDDILPGYLPEGYHYVSGSVDEIMAVSIYEDSNGNTVRINRRKSVGTITYDTERSTVYETTISGNKALVISSPDMNSIYYFGDIYVYNLSGIVDVDELIKVIESLPK